MESFWSKDDTNYFLIPILRIVLILLLISSIFALDKLLEDFERKNAFDIEIYS